LVGMGGEEGLCSCEVEEKTQNNKTKNNNSWVAMYCFTIHHISIHIKSLYFRIINWLKKNPLMDDEQAEAIWLSCLLCPIPLILKNVIIQKLGMFLSSGKRKWEVSGSDNRIYSEWCLLGCYAVWLL
jgi:hypothetical protein